MLRSTHEKRGRQTLLEIVPGRYDLLRLNASPQSFHVSDAELCASVG